MSRIVELYIEFRPRQIECSRRSASQIRQTAGARKLVKSENRVFSREVAYLRQVVVSRLVYHPSPTIFVHSHLLFAQFHNISGEHRGPQIRP